MAVSFLGESLSVEVCRNLLEQKLQGQNHLAENVLSNQKEKKRKIKEALKTCGSLNWTFTKSLRRPGNKKDATTSWFRMWPRCRLPPSNAPTQKLVHPQYETPRLKPNSLLSVVQDSEASADLHIVDVVDLWAPRQKI